TCARRGRAAPMRPSPCSACRTRYGRRWPSSSALPCWFKSCARASEVESEETVALDPDAAPADIAATVATLFRRDSRKVLATLIRLLGDFDLAEEAMQDAFKAASAQSPRCG